MWYRNFLLFFLLIATAYACLYNGKVYLDGQEFIEKNTFLMKCHIKALFSWYVDILSCLTPSRAKIPIGGWLVEGRYNYTCHREKENRTVWFKYDPIINGTTTTVGRNNTNTWGRNNTWGPWPQQRLKCDGRYDIGLRWKEWQFLFECTFNATKIFLGCITETGFFIPANRTATSGGLMFECRQYPNGTATFHGAKLIRTPMLKKDVLERKEKVIEKFNYCVDSNNGTRKFGEYWVEQKNFTLTCTKDGQLKLVNCLNSNLANFGKLKCESLTTTSLPPTTLTAATLESSGNNTTLNQTLS